MAETCDGTGDDLRVYRLDGIIINSQIFQNMGTKIVENNIGTLEEVIKNGPSLRVLQVETNAPFVPVVRPVVAHPLVYVNIFRQNPR